jgi:serine phosphatase RsbU (regulator of sigma subunit)
MRWNVETDEVLISGAGHGGFYLFNSFSKQLKTIETGGVILGITPDLEKYKNEIRMSLHSGDSILMYTDGVTEALNQKEEQFGETNLESSFLSCLGRSPQIILDSIYSDLKEFVKETEQHDDITMVALKKL